MAERLALGMLEECRVVSLPQIPEPRGALTALEELVHIPFRIGRVQWFYDVPAGTSWPQRESRPGDVLVIALSGSFDVLAGRQSASSRVRLSRASIGLHVPGSIHWTVEDTSTNSVCLVISSQPTRRPQATSRRRDEDESRAMDPATTIDACRTLTLPRRRTPHGSSTEVIPQVDVPFEIPRVYYVYDVPGGASRGGHAHRKLEQMLVATAGSFEVVLHDGRRAKTIRLDQANSGIYIPPGIWRELVNFSPGAICLTLASAPYDEADYVRDPGEYRREKRNESRGSPRRM
jgi:dTDP-4-dehydrorhamnose 3,5-epimerase-like enzyme